MRTLVYKFSTGQVKPANPRQAYRIEDADIEAELAKQRQREAGGDRGNQYTGGKVPVPENLPEAAPPGDARDKAAAFVGMSGRTAEKAAEFCYFCNFAMTLETEGGGDLLAVLSVPMV